MSHKYSFVISSLSRFFSKPYIWTPDNKRKLKECTSYLYLQFKQLQSTLKKIQAVGLGEIWTYIFHDTDAMLCQPSKEVLRIVS